jgi:hypothetical protein
MQADNEYEQVLSYLYEKTLILHDTALFNKVLFFFMMDSIAHIDYTLSIYSYNYMSPKNIMGAEYLRWRVDEEKKGDRTRFPGFINWLRDEYPEKFAALPSLWQMIYDTEDPAGYRSFRIVIDPDSKSPVASGFFMAVIDEFFDQDFLKSLYEDASLSMLFKTYLTRNPV